MFIMQYCFQKHKCITVGKETPTKRSLNLVEKEQWGNVNKGIQFITPQIRGIKCKNQVLNQLTITFMHPVEGIFSLVHHVYEYKSLKMTAWNDWQKERSSSSRQEASMSLNVFAELTSKQVEYD